MSWDTKMSPCFTWWQDSSLHRGFIEPLQENLSSSAWGKDLLSTYPARNFLPCMPFSYLASFSKNKGLQYYNVLTGRASSLRDSHFRCENCDDKWRPVSFLLSPCQTLTQKIQLYQQLSSLVLLCEVQSTSPSLFMTHEWNKYVFCGIDIRCPPAQIIMSLSANRWSKWSG